MNLLPLQPLVSDVKPYEFVAFDTEGDGSLGGFVLAAAYDSSGGHIFFRRKDLKDFLFQYANREKRILAANLEYDWAVAFQPFDNHHTLLLDDGRWLQASYHDTSRHTWTAWDIQRIAPISVRAMGEILGIHKYPTPPNLLKGKPRSAEHFQCEVHGKTDCVECYCMRDAEIVYKFAKLFQSELNALGGQLHMTIASCGMDLFRRRFLNNVIAPVFPEKNALARRALYGGRVETFKVGTAMNVRAYDFNSLYPSVMRDLEVAKPNTFHHLNQTARLYQRLEGFGIFRGVVEIPLSYLPTLPIKRGARNFYPTGILRGVWMFSEIRAALERGAKIREMDEIVFADETIKPFGSFVDTLYPLKQLYREKGDQREHIVKLLLTSLWGKFAQREDSSLQTLLVPRKGQVFGDFDGCTPEELCGKIVMLKDIDRAIPPMHRIVPWSSEIASQARVKLLSHLEENEGQLFYCDTDSVHLAGKLTEGEALGELRLAERFERVVYLAPKEYGGLSEEGKFVGHAKGIPQEMQEEFLKSGHVRFMRPNHIKEAFRTRDRLGTWRWVTKERRQNFPCREHEELQNYNYHFVDTLPWDVEGIEGDERDES